MEGLIFWLIVVVIIIFNAFKAKPEESGSVTSTHTGETSWDELPDLFQNRPQERKGPKKSKRQPATNTTAAVNFQPYEAKTGSAMADMIPIWEAAGRGKYEIVEEKLAAGVNVNEPDTFFGETALHRAAKVGDLKMVQILLGHGAKVDLTDQYGETPLHFAITGRNPEVIRTLLKHGADPDREDIFGRSPAHCAGFYTELRDCFAGPTPT